jgi:hypothetical protein
LKASAISLAIFVAASIIWAMMIALMVEVVSTSETSVRIYSTLESFSDITHYL